MALGVFAKNDRKNVVYMSISAKAFKDVAKEIAGYLKKKKTISPGPKTTRPIEQKLLKAGIDGFDAAKIIDWLIKGAPDRPQNELAATIQKSNKPDELSAFSDALAEGIAR